LLILDDEEGSRIGPLRDGPEEPKNIHFCYNVHYTGLTPTSLETGFLVGIKRQNPEFWFRNPVSA